MKMRQTDDRQVLYIKTAEISLKQRFSAKIVKNCKRLEKFIAKKMK